MPECPECGEVVTADDQFCPNCGTDVEATVDEEMEAARTELYDEMPSWKFAGKYLLYDGWGPIKFGVAYTIASAIILLFAPYLFGYAVRLGRAAALRRPSVPSAADRWALFGEGFQYIGIFLVPLLVLFVPIGALAPVANSTEGAVGALLNVALFLLFPVMFYVSIALFTAMLGNGSVLRSFVDGRAISLATSKHFAIAFLIFLPVYVVLGIVVPLSAYTVVGFLVLFPVSLFATAAYWGHVYQGAAEKEIVPPAVEDEELCNR